MNLQLNHIQHYPMGENGLKMIFLKSGRTIELHGIRLNENGNLIFISSDGECFLQKHWDFKPILHPLSDLTKPIKVEGYNDGKEFVPIVELAKIGNKWIIEDGLEDRIYFRPWDTGVCEVFVRTASPEDPRIFVFEMYDYLTQPYRVIQKLFEWHFVVDIPDGTWIDINTLNK